MWNKIVQWWNKPFATFGGAMAFACLFFVGLLLIAVSVGDACVKNDAQQKIDSAAELERAKFHQQHPFIDYYKDTRTGICFAGYIDYGRFNGTAVPCTPQVEAVAKIFTSQDWISK